MRVEQPLSEEQQNTIVQLVSERIRRELTEKIRSEVQRESKTSYKEICSMVHRMWREKTNSSDHITRPVIQEMISSKIQALRNEIHDSISLKVYEIMTNNSSISRMLDQHNREIQIRLSTAQRNFEQTLQHNRKTLTDLSSECITQTERKLELVADRVIDQSLSLKEGSPIYQRMEERLRSRQVHFSQANLFFSLVIGLIGGITGARLYQESQRRR